MNVQAVDMWRELERLLRRDAELRADVAGSDRLVRVRLDSRRDADEHPLDADLTRALELLDRVEDDVRNSRFRGCGELRVRLVVPVHDDPVGVEPGPPREAKLAERRDIRPDPLLARGAAGSATFGNAFVP